MFPPKMCVAHYFMHVIPNSMRSGKNAAQSKFYAHTNLKKRGNIACDPSSVQSTNHRLEGIIDQ